MKKHIFSLIVIFITFGMCVQSQANLTDVQVGSVFKIGDPVNTNYKHIKLPKPHVIIKRGGIANYKHLAGSLVVVSSIDKKKNGIRIVKLKLKNGKRFFGSHRVISAHIAKALESGELLY